MESQLKSTLRARKMFSRLFMPLSADKLSMNFGMFWQRY